jgi:outer membrane protein
MPGGRANRTARNGVRQRWLASVSACALAAVTVIAPGTPASAETLLEALASAYRDNPRIDAERARLRSTDEDVARAKSGYRPQVGASADFGYERNSSSPASTSNGSLDPWGYQVNLSQPLFDGFQTTNSVNQAEASVRAGRENLRNIEGETMMDAVRAYVDVVRDQAIVRIRERNISVLSQELEAAETRRAAREVTRTDVAQAQARRARAVSDADQAKANLKIARARYQQVIGHAPTKVSAPALNVKGLPKSLAEALEIAEQESPNVASALYREEAARHNVDRIWGELLPQVSLEANYTHRGNASNFIDEQDQASIQGRVTVPLYEGGETRARVRQAKHQHVGRLQEIEQARTETEADVTAAWSRLVAARSQVRSDEIQVEATRTALEGTREEEKVGQRLLIDVLNAEQEYLDAQVQLVSTKRDVVVAGYQVLEAIGRLNGEDIDVGGTLYDPEQHYVEARDEWFSTDITYQTVGMPREALVEGLPEPDVTVGIPNVEGEAYPEPEPPEPAPPRPARFKLRPSQD